MTLLWWQMVARPCIWKYGDTRLSSQIANEVFPLKFWSDIEIKVMMSPEVCRHQARDMAGPDPLLYNVVSLSHNCQLYKTVNVGLRCIQYLFDRFMLYTCHQTIYISFKLLSPALHNACHYVRGGHHHLMSSGRVVMTWCEQQLVSPVTISSHHPSACHLSAHPDPG